MLEDGAEAKSVLGYLNGLRCVQVAMEEHFGGERVTAQNLSRWRTGGYREWLGKKEARELALQLREDGEELEEQTAERPVTDWLALAMGVRLAAVTNRLLAEKLEAKEEFERMQPALHELERLRRGDHRAARVRMAKSRLGIVEGRWQQQQDERAKAAEEAAVQKEKDKQLAVLEWELWPDKNKDGTPTSAMALKWAAEAEEIRKDLVPGELTQLYEDLAEEELQQGLKNIAARKAKKEEAEAAGKKAALEEEKAKELRAAAAREADKRAATEAREAEERALARRRETEAMLAAGKAKAQAWNAVNTGGVAADLNKATGSKAVGPEEIKPAETGESRLIALNQHSTNTVPTAKEPWPPEVKPRETTNDRADRAALIEAGLIEQAPREDGT